MNRTLVAAHAGCGISPDNTMASFMEGLATGADIVEVDVRVSKDGTAILLHDDSPYLLSHTYEQLNQPDMRQRIDRVYLEHEIATLEQILQASDPYGTKLNLDLKSADSIDPALRLVRQYDAQQRVFITGYSDTITERYTDIQVMINTPVNLTRRQREQYEHFAQIICLEAKRAGYAGLNMKYETCLSPIVGMAHANGLTVWVYTVNEGRHMERFIQMGVDAITTRKPELLMQTLARPIIGKVDN